MSSFVIDSVLSVAYLICWGFSWIFKQPDLSNSFVVKLDVECFWRLFGKAFDRWTNDRKVEFDSHFREVVQKFHVRFDFSPLQAPFRAKRHPYFKCIVVKKGLAELFHIFCARQDRNKIERGKRKTLPLVKEKKVPVLAGANRD